MEKYFGENTPKLGFGLMRLPKRLGKIDIEQTKKMVDLFMQAGCTYFDTAYVYDGGESERAAKAALVDRYPRESFTLCTKLCAWMGAHDERAQSNNFTRVWSAQAQDILITISFMRCRRAITSSTRSTTFGIS